MLLYTVITVQFCLVASKKERMITPTQQRYVNSFGDMIGQIMNPQENRQMLKDDAFSKGICWNCGESLIAVSDNVGFSEPDPTYNEIEYQCPTGCEQ